jgi:hypothetical protein
LDGFPLLSFPINGILYPLLLTLNARDNSAENKTTLPSSVTLNKIFTWWHENTCFSELLDLDFVKLCSREVFKEEWG